MNHPELIDLNTGELVVWADQSNPDRLLFGIDVADSGGGRRVTVAHDVQHVEILAARLRTWLDARRAT